MWKSFFKDKSLKRIGAYFLAAMFAVLLAEYFIIRYKIEVLEEVEEKKDYARSAQISSQHIALHLQNFLNGKAQLAADIISAVEHQDHLLEVIHKGGRMDGTDVFLKPLSKLPEISFQELDEAWQKYKANVMTVIMAPPGPPATDSLGNVVVTEAVKAQRLLPAQWMTLSNWYSNLEMDLTNEADEKKESVERFVFVFIFADFILLAMLYAGFRWYVIRQIDSIKANTSRQYQETDLPPNELGELTVAVNGVLEHLKDATEFVEAIGQGKLDFDYQSLDATYERGKNKLADSLIQMQMKLKEMSDTEKRRQWANEGLTKFVDILRSSNDDIHQLGDRIIAALVQYTKSNQGGLYVLNDENENDRHLELIAKFAFDVKKHEKQRIKLGEGLLGQTFLERETTLLNEVPEEYVRITSGLGEANPKALLMVPLKVDKNVYGIVELASFNPYQEHEIRFVERLAETIASTLASVKSAQKNRHLIEQFQQQTEEMRAQEEEMRQNMEELQATQEELARKETDYIRRIAQLEEESREAKQLREQLAQHQSDAERQLQESRKRISELERSLSQQPERAEDWRLAEELQKTFKVHAEAMQISNEALAKKA